VLADTQIAESALRANDPSGVFRRLRSPTSGVLVPGGGVFIAICDRMIFDLSEGGLFM